LGRCTHKRIKGKIKSLVVLKVSDGIGAGILLDGSLRVGEKYNAGEIGHTVVEPKGMLCP
jgi:predicted NBD/HSP70 family sugar kinase